MPADIDHPPVEPKTGTPLALTWPVDAESRRRLTRVLARKAVEEDVLRWAMMSDEEIEAEIDRSASLFEGQANHLLAGLVFED